MRTTRRWMVQSLLVGVAMMCAAPTQAQNADEASRHFGSGVQAYFTGNASRAVDDLSLALTIDSQDPRIYYFRALSLLRLGRSDEARGDMLVGAALEAQRPQRFPVGNSLQRVQGRDRLMLEQFRRQARAEAGTIGAGPVVPAAPEAPSDALRRRVVIPLDEYLQSGDPRPAHADASPAPAQIADPPSGPLLHRDQQVASPQAEDPFIDDPQAPEPPATTPSNAASPQDASNSFDAAELTPPESAASAGPEEMPAPPPTDGDAEEPFGP